MRILWLTNIPSPYRVLFFEELASECDLTVVFESGASLKRDESWRKYSFRNFKGVFFKGVRTGVDSVLCPGIIRFLKRSAVSYDHIIISNPLTPTGIIAALYLKGKKVRFLIESDGGFPKNSKGLREWLKKNVIGAADGWFSTAKIHDNYYLAYGAKADKIYRYPFTSLQRDDILKEPVCPAQKQALKEELGICEKTMVLSVGQFIHRKGFDVLLKACADIGEETGVYIVGGTPVPEYLQIIQDLNLKNIHFLPFKLKKELEKYFMAADLFVLPTREDIWGLVVNEAMAFGLPIITTDKCGAGLELITDCENGFIVPVENPNVLLERINEILKNDLLRQRMVECNLKKISQYTIEKMVETHIKELSNIGGW